MRSPNHEEWLESEIHGVGSSLNESSPVQVHILFGVLQGVHEGTITRGREVFIPLAVAYADSTNDDSRFRIVEEMGRAGLFSDEILLGSARSRSESFRKK